MGKLVRHKDLKFLCKPEPFCGIYSLFKSVSVINNKLFKIITIFGPDRFLTRWLCHVEYYYFIVFQLSTNNKSTATTPLGSWTLTTRRSGSSTQTNSVYGSSTRKKSFPPSPLPTKTKSLFHSSRRSWLLMQTRCTRSKPSALCQRKTGWWW